jgi:glycosyltransferase involved in cell wall biosynthesis
VRHELSAKVEAIGILGGHPWEQLELPRLLRGEMLVNFCNTGPMFLKSQLAVLHDAAVMDHPSAYGFRYRTWNRVLFSGIMRNASTVATVSSFSASELMRYFGVRPNGIEIISESGEHILRSAPEPGILSRLGVTDCKYILAVGSHSANKNFRTVIQAATALEDTGVKVVAAGGMNSRIFAGIELKDSNLITAGYVTNGELRTLYENAECFVFPSFYEGFGLPPLEAMHCGCPVLVSRRASLPEVCAEAAAYCDPTDPADVARQLRLILTSSSMQQEMREAGLARAARFSWAKSAEQLESLLANAGGA